QALIVDFVNVTHFAAAMQFQIRKRCLKNRCCAHVVRWIEGRILLVLKTFVKIEGDLSLRAVSESARRGCARARHRSSTSLPSSICRSLYASRHAASRPQSSDAAVALSTHVRCEKRRVQAPCRARCNEAW